MLSNKHIKENGLKEYDCSGYGCGLTKPGYNLNTYLPCVTKKILLLITLFYIGILELSAQRELLNPLINSKIIIAKGVDLYDVGKYKAAIAEYLKVPKSDTAYSEVLHELILSYYKDSNFVEAERYGNIALNLYPDNRVEWYSLLADIYDDTKRSDLALKAYDAILSQNPYSYLTYFNKGITLFRQLKYDEAAASFEECILINPYYAPAHYFLGQLALLKGNLVQAMLSFATNVLVYPGNYYQKNDLDFLNTIAEVNTIATGYLQKYKPGKEDNFDEMQDILVSKLALDKKYKLKAALEDQIVRQLQVVMEKLEYNSGDKGFWMQYYVPLFKNLWDNGNFEPMVFYMLSGLDIKRVKEYNQKEKKKLGTLITAVTGYLNAIRESHELLFNKRSNALEKYYIKNNVITGKGVYGKNVKNEETITGPWEFYYENGRLKSKGSFNSEGMRSGDWSFYYKSGRLKEVSGYLNDKGNGKSLSWYDNGLLSDSTFYADDKIEGTETSYFFNGNLLSVIKYKAGKKDGAAKYYTIDGYLRTVSNYSNNQQNGEEVVYHSNGKPASTVKYVKDMPAGEYREYFDDGKLEMSGNFTNGKKTGEWNSYFKDGKREQLENYTDGELNGEWISYYSNGRIESKKRYSKGEVDGMKQTFDDDGTLLSEVIFEKGRLRDIKFFDKKGTIISNTTSRKGNADIPFYSADGSKLSQGYYSKDGLVDGKLIYYYKNGQVASDGSYQNGLQEGRGTFYYNGNTLRQEGNYKADKSDGYFIDYYNNGKVSGEGWYINDLRQGTFINYDLLGNITSKLYYLDDKIYGISEYYTPAGKPDYTQYYNNGWFNKISQYDSSGNIMISAELNKGEGKVAFKHFNGKPYFESNYKYYKLNGIYRVTNGDGSKGSLAYYKNGTLDSAYTQWHPNGKIQAEGNYANGNKTGTWKYYYFDGRPSQTEQYKDGKREGLTIQYDELGAIDKEIMYKDGALNGASMFYGDNAMLMLVFFYKDDDLVSYTYEDKTGRLLPVIPLIKGGVTVDSYYRNGIKSAHMVINEGVVEGERVLYLTNGKEQVTGNRINGLENGTKKIYYPSGKIMLEENYYYGELHGSSKYYNEDGTPIYHRNYYLGNLHGDSKYYTAGKLAQTYTYYYGALESKK